jgi:hypothetical protein
LVDTEKLSSFFFCYPWGKFWRLIKNNLNNF